MAKVDTKELKKLVKIVNDSGLLTKIDQNKLKFVGVKTLDLLDNFIDAVYDLSDAKLAEELPAEVIEFCNEHADEEPDEKEKEELEKKEKKKETKKKDKPAKKEKKKSPGEAKPRACYGHIASAKSGALDELLNKGATYKELMEECDVKLHRIKSHITVLKKKGLTLLTKEDKDDSKNTHVQIKEDSI